MTAPLRRRTPYARPHNTLARAFGQALIAARGTTSRREQARQLGVDPSHLLDIEHGRLNPTLDVVERYAAAYGITITLHVGGAA